RRFEHLARSGHEVAKTMLAACHSERGDCLRDLLRYSEAEHAYEESVRKAEAKGNLRQVAVVNGQLGTLQARLGNYGKAISAHTQAVEAFKALGEAKLMATAWLQLGQAQSLAGQNDDAEQSLLTALRNSSHPAIQSSALASLGNVYAEKRQLEEAVRVYRRAVDDFEQQGEWLKGAQVRRNIAKALLELRRYDEAREELRLAREKSRPFGVAAAPWDLANLLYELENASGSLAAAKAARQEAIRAYLAFRREGGACLYNPELFSHISEQLEEGYINELIAELEEVQNDVTAHPDLRPLVRALARLFRGSRDPALAEEPHLHYLAAAELLLLLEVLPPPSDSK
ncbi:MAG TPA: tetratricopeptide repeat protein, partial [Archangium sp.]|nr:tetratricopeptide repeat protein [Archangium sp.]